MEGTELEGEEPTEAACKETAISSVKQRPMTISSGLISKANYVHRSKNCDIQSVTYNSKTGDYIIVDSRGITAWTKSFAADKTSRLMDFPAYQFNVIKILLYCRKFNVYFALSKDYQLKVYNLNFHETFSVESDTNSVIHMLFNAATNELITASTGELQFWQFGEMSHQSDLLQAKYGLILIKKWSVADGKLITRLRLDEELQRLYCLSEKDVWCYDLFGRLIFKITEACQVHLSACAYSIPVHSLIVGSIDGQINVLTTSGGKIHTFYSHIGLITEILVHPSDDSLVVTSSLDGHIKIFSLDIFEELYSLRVFNKGIEFMALRSNELLYCASLREVEIFDLNYLYQFWGQLRYPAQRIQLVKNATKSLRVLALAEDGSVRLFANADGKKLCTILPAPSVSATSRVLDCVHDRDYNLVYLLVKVTEVWVYTTKTDPACHLAVLDLLKETANDNTHSSLGRSSSQVSRTTLDQRGNCNCIEVLQDLIEVEFLDSNGVIQTKCNFLACGMDSGEIILYNPLRSGKKEKEIKLCKDPIMSMKYYRAMLRLMLLTRAKEGVFIQIFDKELICVASIACSDDLTVFSLKNTMLAIGFSSGHVLLQEWCTVHQDSLELAKGPPEHQSAVQSVSFHPTLDILCSSAKDSCIKLWSTDKTLLCDIVFECGLTTACFLNSLGDILIGLKNQIFIIKHEGKLSWLADNRDPKEELKSNESEIYESPYLKYEIKRPSSPEAESMERYLVPYQDMMFSSVGSWVVVNDDATSDLNIDDRKIDEFLSDDVSSNAPSDIYQSSIFTDFSDMPENYWQLPECIVSPDESTASSGEETLVDEDDLLWTNKDDEEVALVQKPIVDPKTKLELMLKQSKKTVKSARKADFSHTASEKLRKAKIDAKAIRKSQNSRLTRNMVAKKEVVGSADTEQVARAKGTKKVVKKANKSIGERRRAAQKQNMVAVERLKEPDEEQNKDESEVVIDDVTSPDAGYQSQVSVVNDEKSYDTEDKQEEVGTGVLITGNATLNLKKVSLRPDQDNDDDGSSRNVSRADDVRSISELLQVLNNDENDEEVLGESVGSGTRPSTSIPNSKPSRTQTASTFASKKDFPSSGKSSRNARSSIDVLEFLDKDSEFHAPPSLSSSSLGSYAASSSDILSTDESTDSEEMNFDDVKTHGNVSMKTASTRVHEYISTRVQQEDVKVKVVPAFSQQLSVTVDASNRIPSRTDQNIPLTVYSLSNRASSRLSISRKDTGSPPSRAVSRQQRQTPMKSPEIIDSGSKSRQSMSPSRFIRVPFGQLTERDNFISSQTIRNENKKPPDKEESFPQTKEEKKKDLVNFCVSALKQRKKPPGRASPLKSPTAMPSTNDDAEVIEQVAMHNSANGLPTSPIRPVSSNAVVSEGREINLSHAETLKRSNLELKNSPDMSSRGQTTDILDKKIAENTRQSFAENLKISYDIMERQRSESRSSLKGNFESEHKMHRALSAEVSDRKTVQRNAASVFVHWGAFDNKKFDTEDIAKYSSGGRSGLKTSEIFDVNDVPIDIYRRAKSTLRVASKNRGVSSRSLDEDDVFARQSYQDAITLIDSEEKSNVLSKKVTQPRFAVVSNDKTHTREEAEKGEIFKDVQESKQEKKVVPRRKDSSKFDENSVSNFEREGSKGRLIFVNVPGDDECKEGRSARKQTANYREDIFSPVSISSVDLDKAKASNSQKDGQRKAIVASVQDKLLKRRVLNAVLKERQTSAKFRREVIEKQKLARSRSHGASPSFSAEYETEFLPEAVGVNDKASVTYEYGIPVPLNEETKKPQQGTNKALQARLSGQPFRYGRSISQDKNEGVIVEFIKSTMNKDKKKVVLLPRPKSSPSIPAKCHDFVLVKEKSKHQKSLSKLERDLLSRRFNDFSMELT